MTSGASHQLRTYLRLRRSGVETASAAEQAGISLAEAKLTDADEARGFLAGIDTTESAPVPIGASPSFSQEEPMQTETAGATPRTDDRAADGTRLPPAANSFGDFVRFLEDGQLDRELTEQLRTIASDMANEAIDGGGKSKGKLTVTFDFALEGRVFTIASKHKTELPQAKRQKSVMWSTEDGRFTPSNPQQMQMFGMREVRGPGFRDA